MRVTYKILDINGASLSTDTIRVSDLKQQTLKSVTAGGTTRSMTPRQIIGEDRRQPHRTPLNHRRTRRPLAPAAQYRKRDHHTERRT